MRKLSFKKFETTGFATPSGKVELKSTVLESLGFDPLPYYRAEPPQDPAFPFMAFTGVREDEFFQTGHRHIASLRSRRPEPEIFLHPNDAVMIGVVGGEWIEVSTIQGSCKGRTAWSAFLTDGGSRKCRKERRSFPASESSQTHRFVPTLTTIWISSKESRI